MWYDLVERAKNNPVMVFSLVEVLIGLAVAFGLDLDGKQVAAIMSVVAVLTGVGARSQAWGPKTVNRILDADAVISAAESGISTPTTIAGTPESDAFEQALSDAEETERQRSQGLL